LRQNFASCAGHALLSLPAGRCSSSYEEAAGWAAVLSANLEEKKTGVDFGCSEDSTPLFQSSALTIENDPVIS
jgi:hypothetical protein